MSKRRGEERYNRCGLSLLLEKMGRTVRQLSGVTNHSKGSVEPWGIRVTFGGGTRRKPVGGILMG